VDYVGKISKYEHVKNFPSTKTEIFPSPKPNPAARPIQNHGADAAGYRRRGGPWYKGHFGSERRGGWVPTPADLWQSAAPPTGEATAFGPTFYGAGRGEFCQVFGLEKSCTLRGQQPPGGRSGRIQTWFASEAYQVPWFFQRFGGVFLRGLRCTCPPTLRGMKVYRGRPTPGRRAVVPRTLRWDSVGPGWVSIP
jgi:hypothetical protein